MSSTALRIEPAPHRRAADDPLAAVIDIGSNSIRLAVYRAGLRVPTILFNEKVTAGLGRGVAADGRLSESGLAAAEAALARFAALCDAMGVASLRAIATAAVRDASNRDEFVARAKACCGLDVEVLSGDEEARYAALGVIAGIPGADGVVGDLGGGSLELIRIAGGKIHESTSMPIGALRLEAARKRSKRGLPGFIARALKTVDWPEAGRGRPFYMVGGSWRALAQLHMTLTQHPLPIVHQHVIAADVPARLVRTLARIKPTTLKAVPNISASRVPALPGAATLLRATMARLGSSAAVASAYGLREGVLFDALPEAVRREDPLIAAVRAEGAIEGRFPEHGDALAAWMAPAFADEPGDARLRLAACLLSDVAWRTHPDFRAERGMETALHGNWVAVTARERAMIGMALFACFGGADAHPATALLHTLADPPSLVRARAWGLALRLGQRLSGGTAAPLAGGGLRIDDDTLVLALGDGHAALAGEVVARRLKALAGAMGLKCDVRLGGAGFG